MTLRIFLISLVLLGPSIAEDPKIKYDYTKGMHAAYFGDTETLKQLIGPKESLDSIQHINPSVLIGYAMASSHKETVKAILDYGWPSSSPDLRDVFRSPHMTGEMVSVFADNIPNFSKKFGPDCLASSTAAGYEDVARELLALGISANEGRDPPLLLAVLNRNENLIDLLLKNEADPYLGRKPRRPVDIAAGMRSHNLLRKIDVKGEYRDLSAELKKSMPPAKSKFIGSWSHKPPGGGFGTISLRLNPDGSGFIVGGMGGNALVWSSLSKNKARIEPISPVKKAPGAPEKKLELTLAQNDELTIVGLEKNRILKRIAANPKRDSKWRYPIFIRLENAWLTPKEDLIVQINGMRKKISLDRILEGARQSNNHYEPTEKNVLQWSDFNEVDQVPIPKGSTHLKIGDRKVSPKYSRSSRLLSFGHKKTVTLEEGATKKIFPLMGEMRYRGEPPTIYSHQVLGWALMQKEKFSHDRDWLVFYLQKSSENKHTKQSATDQSTPTNK